MPAWGGPGTAEGSCHLVHFIRHPPNLTAEQEARMEALNPKSPEEWRALQDEDVFLRGEQPELRGLGARVPPPLKERKMNRTMKIIALAAALVAAPVAAHEKGDRAMGVIASVTPAQIVVRTSDGHSVAFAVTAETRFFRGERPARSGDVRVGQRAVIHGKRAGEALQAMRVKLGDGTKSR